jgi:hypothetical protein
MVTIKPITLLVLCVAPIAAACNSQRKAECDKFLGTMAPLDDGTPGADAVERVRAAVDAIQFQDEPLREYARNYKNTLTVLSNTLKLKASPTPPDGTDDVIKAQLKAARTDKADIARYCSQ